MYTNSKDPEDCAKALFPLILKDRMITMSVSGKGNHVTEKIPENVYGEILG